MKSQLPRRRLIFSSKQTIKHFKSEKRQMTKIQYTRSLYFCWRINICDAVQVQDQLHLSSASLKYFLWTSNWKMVLSQSVEALSLPPCFFRKASKPFSAGYFSLPMKTTEQTEDEETNCFLLSSWDQKKPDILKISWGYVTFDLENQWRVGQIGVFTRKVLQTFTRKNIFWCHKIMQFPENVFWSMRKHLKFKN